MWKKDLFTLLYSFRGEGYLGLCVEVDGIWTYLVNLYASCNCKDKRSIWKNIVDFKNSNAPGSWCVCVCGGGVNTIADKEERIGITTKNNLKEINVFKCFIDEMELVDLPTMGGKVTWFKNNGKVMSRIYRFLLSVSFIDKWCIDGQSIGGRDISDLDQR